MISLIKRGFLLLLYLLICYPMVSGQESCGVTHADQIGWWSRYADNLRKIGPGERTESVPVPVAFHLVARENSTGRAPVDRMLEAFCTTRETLDSAGISVYLAPGGILQENHDGVFFQHHLAANQQAMRGMAVDSAINIFVVADAGSGSAGTVLGYYDQGDDWIVISRNALAGGNLTLTHEIGHFFSLLHPHFGWDAQAWNAAIHGPQADSLSPDGSTPTETMDGNNCAIAGDRLCDTPPDFNVGLAWQQNCAYAGNARDRDSILIDPDESLIMSYFSDACRRRFSAQQQSMMLADWNHPDRAFLHRAFSPSQDSLTQIPDLIGPDTIVESVDGQVLFSWKMVSGAKQYLLQIDRSAAFNLSPQTILTTDTFLILPGPWLAGSGYFWRVFAFHEANTCLPPSVTTTFSVNMVTSLHPEGSRSTIAYLPATHQIRVAGLSGEQSIELISLDGRCLMNIHPSTGPQSALYSLPSLPPGVYVLRSSSRYFPDTKILIPPN